MTRVGVSVCMCACVRVQLGTSPLHLAAGNGHAETCAVLLRAGVSRDSRTKVDRTPLHLAAYEGHEGVVSLLVQQGALVDCRDMLRMTPLHWAAQRGHAAAARELLRRGADPLAVSKFGATPVSLARRSQPGGELARLLEEAARAREAARSVRALVSGPYSLILAYTSTTLRALPHSLSLIYVLHMTCHTKGHNFKGVVLLKKVIL